MNSDAQTNNVQKKRGRKPKIVKPTGNKTKEDIKKNQNIILHLNITEEDLLTETVLPLETNKVYHKYTENKQERETEDYIKYINQLIEDRNSLTTCNNSLFLEYNNANRTKKWPSKTNIDCFWDGHPFETCPVGIPMKRSNNILYMFGNFCSPECAAAYNFSMNDDNIWERYSLINEIYSKNSNKSINIANSKLLLKKYGGIYNINEYRMNNINTNFILNINPVISYIPTIEEISKNYSKIDTFNEIDTESEYNRNRHTTILNNKNRLENIMNIKYI